MFIKVSSAIPHYRFSLLEQYSSALAHAVFTRAGGVSTKPFDALNVRYGIGDPDESVTKNRHMMQLFFEKEFLRGKQTVMFSANQTHSDHVFSLHQGELLPEGRGGIHEIDDTDALVTDRSDVSLLLQVADCQPVILLDTKKNILGMVHNGWRGAAQDILGKTIRVMEDEFAASAADMVVCVGPSIGPCCHYFTDPVSELPEAFHRYILDDKRVDFLSATRDQLMARGVAAEHIEFSGVCTSDHANEFFSYRRENRLTGRFGVMAALT